MRPARGLLPTFALNRLTVRRRFWYHAAAPKRSTGRSLVQARRVATDPEALLEGNLRTVERIVRSLCSRYGHIGDEADDFASWVNAALVENDYAIVRAFEGRSSFSTYLVTVISRLFLDYRRETGGRWRASAAARKSGPLAVRLETLLYRDGYTARQAVEIIKSQSETPVDDEQIARIIACLPERVPAPQKVDLSLHDPPADTQAYQELVAQETAQLRQVVEHALNRALASIEPESQLILRLRYWEGFSVADIARTMHLEQKPLYGRLNKLLKQLQAALIENDVNDDVLAELFSELPA